MLLCAILKCSIAEVALDSPIWVFVLPSGQSPRINEHPVLVLQHRLHDIILILPSQIEYPRHTIEIILQTQVVSTAISIFPPLGSIHIKHPKGI